MYCDHESNSDEGGKTALERQGTFLWRLLTLLLITLLVSGRIGIASPADGIQDNIPSNVRRIPKDGVLVPAEREAMIRTTLRQLQDRIQQVRESGQAAAITLLPDVMIFERAVRCALDYNEFFDPKDIAKADRLLQTGLQRADQLLAGNPEWPSQKGLVVRGYISRIDQTVQPYGLVIPETYAMDHSVPVRCDIWFHGRGETLSEVNFLAEHMQSAGQFTPAHTIVLHPYGRYCNAFKFAGEVDVLESLADVQTRYRIDDHQISVRGFSMGGAACWQFAVHYPDRWFAANPGAGFSETPRFLNVFQQEELHPQPWEQTLWNLYDCDKYAVNLAHCPTIAYSGELDRQKQAADVMEEALLQHGIRLRHVIGAGMGHRYDDASKQIVEAGLASLAGRGRDTRPAEIHFTTFTLKYNRMHWLTVEGLAEHWRPAVVTASLKPPQDQADALVHSISIRCRNVTALSLNFPAGSFAPAVTGPGRDVRTVVEISSVEAEAGVGGSESASGTVRAALSFSGPYSDGSLQLRLHRAGDGTWVAGERPESLRKRSGLQGPIDDALMDSFVFVRPTGKAAHAAAGSWAESELARATEHWRRHFRGDARVVNDSDVTDDLIQSANLVLWGDPSSNQIIGRILEKLPITWSRERLELGSRSFNAADHLPILIYPNPLNPNRYVVLNSSFTFRDYAYLNNARQVPMLPDWAVIDLTTPPNSVWPGRVAAADFFDENWQLKP